MKIAVFGAGAMGSIYAALLADAGHEVVVVDVWKEHIDAINQHGLRDEGASGDRTITSIHASAEPALAGQADLYIIATKASGVGSAALAAWPLMRTDSLVLTIQNGLGAGERIAEHMPVDTYCLAWRKGLGRRCGGLGMRITTA